MISLQEFMNIYNESYSNLLQFIPQKMIISSKLKNYVYCIETLVTKFHSSYFVSNPKLLEQLPRYKSRFQKTMTIGNYKSLMNTFQIVSRDFLELLLSFVPYNLYIDVTNTKDTTYKTYDVFDIYDMYDVLNNETPISNIFQLSPSTFLCMCVYPEEAKRLESLFHSKSLVYENEHGKNCLVCHEIICKYLNNDVYKNCISKEFSWNTKSHKQYFHHINPITNTSIKLPLHNVIEETYTWKFRNTT